MKSYRYGNLPNGATSGRRPEKRKESVVLSCSAHNIIVVSTSYCFCQTADSDAGINPVATLNSGGSYQAAGLVCDRLHVKAATATNLHARIWSKVKEIPEYINTNFSEILTPLNSVIFQFLNQQMHFLFSYFCSIYPTHVSAVTLPSSGVHW